MTVNELLLVFYLAKLAALINSVIDSANIPGQSVIDMTNLINFLLKFWSFLLQRWRLLTVSSWPVAAP